jgi:hypothetical protein
MILPGLRCACAAASAASEPVDKGLKLFALHELEEICQRVKDGSGTDLIPNIARRVSGNWMLPPLPLNATDALFLRGWDLRA